MTLAEITKNVTPMFKVCLHKVKPGGWVIDILLCLTEVCIFKP